MTDNASSDYVMYGRLLPLFVTVVWYAATRPLFESDGIGITILRYYCMPHVWYLALWP